MALLTWLKHYQFDLQKAATKDFSSLRKELLAIKGIGEETADALLVYVFDQSTFIADKYAQRMFEKFGFVSAGYKQLKEKLSGLRRWTLSKRKIFTAGSLSTVKFT